MGKDWTARSLLTAVAGTAAIAHHMHAFVRDGLIPAFTGSQGATDLRVYYDAVTRFRHDPSTLYDLRGFLYLGYLYPPPSVLIFLPFTYLPKGLAFLAFTAVSAGCLFAALSLAANLLESTTGRILHRTERLVLLIVAVSLGPVIDNFVNGQVNTIVLLCCVLFFWFLERGRLASAGAVLAVGVWFKIYPAVLFLATLRSRRDLRTAGVAAGFFVAIPISLLSIIPQHSYYRFAGRMRDLAAVTSAHIDNQSLSGALARVIAGPTSYLSWAPVANEMRWLSLAFILASSLVILRRLHSADAKERAVLNASIIALIPVASPIGWGHTYVLALPLVLLSLVSINIFRRGERQDRLGDARRPTNLASVVKISIVLGTLAFLAPAWTHYPQEIPTPNFLILLFYSRYAMAVVGLAIATWWLTCPPSAANQGLIQFRLSAITGKEKDQEA